MNQSSTPNPSAQGTKPESFRWLFVIAIPIVLLSMAAFAIWTCATSCKSAMDSTGGDGLVFVTVVVVVYGAAGALLSVITGLKPDPPRPSGLGHRDQ